MHDAGDGFALAVGRDGALAQLGADLHVGHVAHINRRVALRRDDDVLDIAHVLHQPEPAHDVLLRLCSMKLPLAFALFFSSASKTCCRVTL